VSFLFRRAATYAEMVKLQHALFALPFALAGALLGARGIPDGRTLAAVVAAMVGLRSAAMAFNRWVDRRFDAANPRTAGRELPTGRVSPRETAALIAGGLALFLAACALLGRWPLALAPLAIAVTFGYSWTKRFTAGSHLVLGAALALAPFGGYLAAHAAPGGYPWALSGAVLFWVAGFDVLYACLDAEFDVAAGLHSIPARLGKRGALRLARLFHALAFALFAAAGAAAGLGPPWWIGLALAGLALVAQHVVVSPDDLSRVQLAFFRLNAAVSITLLVATWLALARS
jgi:4-hydroxybenzoate polyprenyltransferase